MNDRIPATDVTCPKVGKLIDVPTPEYCTVLKTLFAVTLASNDRVSPSATVRDSEASTATIPGPSIDPRDAVPYPFGATNAAVLNQSRMVPSPEIGSVNTLFGRRVLLVPVAVSATVET